MFVARKIDPDDQLRLTIENFTRAPDITAVFPLLGLTVARMVKLGVKTAVFCLR